LKASKLSNAQAQRQTIARDRERTQRMAMVSARLDLEFADGRVGATADADRPAATGPAKPVATEPKSAPKRVVKPVGQGSLF
jgi:hypothetical protein